MIVRVIGDVVAMSPPLIIQEGQVRPARDTRPSMALATCSDGVCAAVVYAMLF